MSTSSRLTEAFISAKEIPFDDSSKFILFSDCHRGDNSWADDFAPNQSIYFHALQHYYNNGFTYIELGDGDELLENGNFEDIRESHSHVFWLMREFHREKRLYLIYGNHDRSRKNPKNVKKDFEHYYDEKLNALEPLLKGIEVHESIILRHKCTGDTIFLVHGHQGELISEGLWWVSKFAVRYFWKYLQLLGVHDPTSPARNFKWRKKREREIIEWISMNNNQILICGHTHRPTIPADGQPSYFNTGSCVHPRCITGMEIQGGEIKLIKWWINASKDGALRLEKVILGNPYRLAFSFSTNDTDAVPHRRYALSDEFERQVR